MHTDADKKASKQKSQDDMMNAIDRLSNVKRNREKQTPKVESKKIEEKKVEVTVNPVVRNFL